MVLWLELLLVVFSYCSHWDTSEVPTPAYHFIVHWDTSEVATPAYHFIVHVYTILQYMVAGHLRFGSWVWRVATPNFQHAKIRFGSWDRANRPELWGFSNEPKVTMKPLTTGASPQTSCYHSHPHKCGREISGSASGRPGLTKGELSGGSGER